MSGAFIKLYSYIKENSQGLYDFLMMDTISKT